MPPPERPRILGMDRDTFFYLVVILAFIIIGFALDMFVGF